MAAAPVVSPLTDLLQHRTTIIIIAGVLMLLGLPYVPNITPERVDLLTNVVVGAMGLLGVRFSLEGVMQTRADLKQVVDSVKTDEPPTPPAEKQSSDATPLAERETVKG